MISSVQRVNSMTEEDHPVSSPLLSNYSDGSENKTTGLNDDTDNERSGSSRISEVSCLAFNSVYMFFFSMHMHAKNETDSERSGSSMIPEVSCLTLNFIHMFFF